MALRLFLLVIGLLAVLNSASATYCGHGISGVVTGKYCCPTGCGTCGGSTCASRPGGPSQCCTSQITKSCSSVTAAPCIITAAAPAPAPTTSSVCASGSIPDAAKKVCCPSSCGSCGGNGCDTRPGGYKSCCSGTIASASAVCSSTVKAPCKLQTSAPVPAPVPAPTPTGVCAAGSIPDAGKKVCCPSTCGSCGGTGCDKRPGGYKSCCSGTISGASSVCSSTVKAPCKLAPVEPPTGACAAGDLPNFDNTACCPASCEICGGNDCNYRSGGAPNCCSSNIAAGNRVCSASVKAPCKLLGYTPPPTPTPIVCSVAAGEVPCGRGGNDYGSHPDNTCCTAQQECFCNQGGGGFGCNCQDKPRNIALGGACKVTDICVGGASVQCLVDLNNPNPQPLPQDPGVLVYNKTCQNTIVDCPGAAPCGATLFRSYGLTPNTMCCGQGLECYFTAFGQPSTCLAPDVKCPQGQDPCGAFYGDEYIHGPETFCCAQNQQCDYERDNTSNTGTKKCYPNLN